MPTVTLSEQQIATIEKSLRMARAGAKAMLPTMDHSTEAIQAVDAIDSALAALRTPVENVGGQVWEPVEEGWYADEDIFVAINKRPLSNALCIKGLPFIARADMRIAVLPDDIRLCRRRPTQAQPALPGPLVVNEYQLLGGGPDSPESFVVRRMVQRDGSDKWAIYDDHRAVLSREYEWEYEPLPSSRDDEYLRRCRYDTKDEALEHWREWLRRQRPTQAQE